MPPLWAQRSYTTLQLREHILLAYIAERLVKAAFILIAILVLNFMLIHAAPGDPAAVMAGEAGAADEKFRPAGAGRLSRRQNEDRHL